MNPASNFLVQAYLSYKGLFLWLNWPAYISNVFLRPVLFMALFALVGRFANDDAAPERYAIGTTAIAMPMILLGGITQSFHYERQFGTLWVLCASSGSRVATYLSRGVLHYPNALLSAATALIAGWGLFDVGLGDADWAVLPAAILLMALSSTMFALVMGSLAIAFRDWFNVLAFSVGLVTALTEAFVPRSELPGVLGEIGVVLPLTSALPALRDALSAGEANIGEALLGELAVAAAYAAIGLVLFRVLERSAKSTGAYETV